MDGNSARLKIMTETILYQDDDGLPATGLTVTLSYLTKVSDNSAVSPLPTVSEVGHGVYKFEFDNDLTDDYIYRADCGVVENITNRYAYGNISAKIDYSLSVDGISSIIDAIYVKLIGNTGKTFEQILQTMRAIDAGKRSILGTNNIYYQENGTVPQIQATITSTGRTITEEAS